jgi:hypothetical protein
MLLAVVILRLQWTICFISLFLDLMKGQIDKKNFDLISVELFGFPLRGASPLILFLLEAIKSGMLPAMAANPIIRPT